MLNAQFPKIVSHLFLRYSYSNVSGFTLQQVGEVEDDVGKSSYGQVLRESELCISLLMVEDDRDVEPVKVGGGYL